MATTVEMPGLSVTFKSSSSLKWAVVRGRDMVIV